MRTSVYNELSYLTPEERIELASQHPSGMLKKRRRVVKLLVAAAAVAVMVATVGEWAKLLTESPELIARNAAETVHIEGVETWIASQLTEAGYVGDVTIRRDELNEVIERFYRDVTVRTLVDPGREITLDLNSVLAFLPGRWEGQVQVEAPDTVAVASQLETLKSLRVGGWAVAVGAIIAAIAVAFPGGGIAVGWALRRFGVRVGMGSAFIGGLVALMAQRMHDRAEIVEGPQQLAEWLIYWIMWQGTGPFLIVGVCAVLVALVGWVLRMR